MFLQKTFFAYLVHTPEGSVRKQCIIIHAVESYISNRGTVANGEYIVRQRLQLWFLQGHTWRLSYIPGFFSLRNFFHFIVPCLGGGGHYLPMLLYFEPKINSVINSEKTFVYVAVYVTDDSTIMHTVNGRDRIENFAIMSPCT